ncbi:hypothetical protein ACFL5U_00035 [Candidatus Margulisiibacteriota bacterium]
MIGGVPSNKPHIPAPAAKEAAKDVKKGVQKEDQAAKAPRKVAPRVTNVGRGPEMDSAALAVRLAALATEAKEMEKAREFKEILEKVIELTGMTEPEAAMEEASKQLQKEIFAELERIKANKELMDEAQDWQKFADLLASMGTENAEAMVGMLRDAVRELT